MPSVHGEDAVIRILDKESISEQFTELRLDILGFPEAELKRFRKYIAEPYGMASTPPTSTLRFRPRLCAFWNPTPKPR